MLGLLRKIRKKKTGKVITLDFTEVALKEKQKEKTRKKRFLFNLFALGAGFSLAVMPLKSAKADGFLGRLFSSKNEETKIKVEECYQALDELVELLRAKANVDYDSLSEKDKEKIHRYLTLFYAPDLFLESEKGEICRERILNDLKIPHRLNDWRSLPIFPISSPSEKLSSSSFKVLLIKNIRFNDHFDSELFAPVMKKVYNDTFEVLIYPLYDDENTSIKKYRELEKREDLKFCFAHFKLHPFTIPGSVEYLNKITCPFVHLEKEFDSILREIWINKVIEKVKKEKQRDWVSTNFPEDRKLVGQYYQAVFYEILRQTILWLDREFGKKGRGLI